MTFTVSKYPKLANCLKWREKQNFNVTLAFNDLASVENNKRIS